MKKMFMLVFLVLGMMVFTACTQEQKDQIIEKKLTKAAEELNKTCPKTIDKDTRLDKAIALPGKKFQYNYTLVNLAKADISDLDKLKETARPIILNALKATPMLKTFKDNNVTLIYAYSDKNGVFLFNIEFQPEEYK